MTGLISLSWSSPSVSTCRVSATSSGVSQIIATPERIYRGDTVKSLDPFTNPRSKVSKRGDVGCLSEAERCRHPASNQVDPHDPNDFNPELVSDERWERSGFEMSPISMSRMGGELLGPS